MTLGKGEEYEDEDDTQKIVLEVAASICNSTILGVKDMKKKKNKKSNSKKDTNDAHLDREKKN